MVKRGTVPLFRSPFLEFLVKTLLKVIEATLNETRLNLSKRRAVKGEEFMNALALEEPLYKEKEDAYTSWYEKTPIGKKRKKLMAPAEDGDGGDAKKKGKGRLHLALFDADYSLKSKILIFYSEFRFK